jgi:predicted RNase H-like nuclease (RuvC/YqgF family)
MINEHDPALRRAIRSEVDETWLQRELEEARKTIRQLTRQLNRERARYDEISRAYTLTVANLVTTTGENASLERERDLWKARAEGRSMPFNIGAHTLELTGDEVRAIRKAMARLHHPDAGGDAERMKAWNAALDVLER